MKGHDFSCGWVFWGLVSAGCLLILFPVFDLWAASLFFDPQLHGFCIEIDPFFRALREAVDGLGRALSATLVLALFILHLIKAQAETKKKAWFLVLCLLLGPGLIVNGVFKEHWGRPRPKEVLQFEGKKTFVRAAQPSSQCQKNCSFPSGHASLGFYFVSFAYVFASRRFWRRCGFWGGAGLGAMRMAQGGHFLSDVVFAGVFVCGAIWLCAKIMGMARDQAPD